MIYSLNLIKKFINIDDDVSTISKYLTLKSCEIEWFETRMIPELVVIWKCVEVYKHPDADKLNICKVDCWDKWVFQIITWWTNIKQWYFVPVALEGCYLPVIDLKISARKMRWVDSIWMICSKNELWIKEDVDEPWIWLLDEDLDWLDNSVLWKPIWEAYSWLNNTLFDVDNKTLTNRPDLTWHFWISNELYSIYSLIDKTKLKYNRILNIRDMFLNTDVFQTLSSSNKSNVWVMSQTQDLNTYIAIKIEWIEIKKSKFYSRLQLLDLNSMPRNNWVDFSNLFMNITWQPVHFFDADKINWDIIIRNAIDWEIFQDLFWNEYVLKSEDIVIADKSKLLALAWIVWSSTSWVSDYTKNIVVEIANFNPIQVRKTWTRLWLRTDAEMRFEKKINPAYSLYCLLLFLDELNYYKKDLWEFSIPWISYYVNDKVKESIFNSIDINLDIATEFIFWEPVKWFVNTATDILHSLWFWVNWQSFTTPIWRWYEDIKIKQDLYEEIIRIYWYENVIWKPLFWVCSDTWYIKEVALNRKIEDVFVGKFSFNQIETYPWYDKNLSDSLWLDVSESFTVKNAVAPENTNLRWHIFPNLLNVIKSNFRKYDNIKIFEIWKVWRLDNNQNINDYKSDRSKYEKSIISWAIYIKEWINWQDDVFLNIKWYIENMLKLIWLNWKIDYKNDTQALYFHPKQQWSIYFNWQKIWIIWKLHLINYDYFKFPDSSQVWVFEIYLNELSWLIDSQDKWIKSCKYETLSDSVVYKDLCFVLDKDQYYWMIIEALKKVKNVSEVNLFDLYEWSNIPEWKKSISVTIWIVSEENFTSEHINNIINEAIQKVEKVWWQLRW